MIFLDVTIDNFYSFNNSNVNFTYPRRSKNSTIPDEFLEGRENFRYKRVVIISGANASGKTAFGRILCAFHNFIIGRELVSDETLISLKSAMNDKNKAASFKVYFATAESHRLHCINAIFDHENGLSYELYAYVDIEIGDSYESAKKRLDMIIDDKSSLQQRHYYNADDSDLKKVGFKSVLAMKNHYVEIHNCWSYDFCQISNTDAGKEFNFDEIDTKKCKSILQDFDSSIEDVFYIEKNKSLNIKFNNNDIVTIEKEMSNKHKNRLSRGTYEAIEVAVFLEHLIKGNDCTYFLDEKLSYAHTELEKAIVNLMIQKLGRNAQLFYTTHNYDILEMIVPHHTHMFMKNDGGSQFVYPEKTMHKNDRTLLNYVRNDVFQTQPSSYNMDELL